MWKVTLKLMLFLWYFAVEWNWSQVAVQGSEIKGVWFYLSYCWWVEPMVIRTRLQLDSRNVNSKVFTASNLQLLDEFWICQWHFNFIWSSSFCIQSWWSLVWASFCCFLASSVWCGASVTSNHPQLLFIRSGKILWFNYMSSVIDAHKMAFLW
jgi:hypothetical protein